MRRAVFDGYLTVRLPNYNFPSLKILNFLNDHDTREISVVKLASIKGAELMKYISASLIFVIAS